MSVMFTSTEEATHSLRQHVVFEQSLQLSSLLDDGGLGSQDIECLGQLAELLLCHPGIILDLGRLLGLAGSGTRLRSSSFGFSSFFCFLGFSFGFLLGLSSFLFFLKMSATPWPGVI